MLLRLHAKHHMYFEILHILVGYCIVYRSLIDQVTLNWISAEAASRFMLQKNRG